MGKTKPLNDGDLFDFIDKQESFANSPKSWSVTALTGLTSLGEFVMFSAV